MTQSDEIKNGLVNDMVNALIKDNNTSKVNFTTISYNENVKVNEVDPNAKDSNGAIINYKEAVGNSVKSVLDEVNSIKNTRKLGSAINEAIKFFNKNNEKNSIKNIIIISEGEPTDQIPTITLNQYNVITLAINKTSSYVNDYPKLKEWHKALGGSEENYFISSSAESHNDISSNTSTSGNDKGEICKKVATRLETVNYKSYSLKDVKLNFNLGGNFEPVGGLTYSTDNKDICTIDLPNIRYIPISSTGGKSKYKYEYEDFKIPFIIKPKQGKAGELKFAAIGNDNQLKNYISYTKVVNQVAKVAIETPTINVLKPNISILEVEPADSFKITNKVLSTVVNTNTKVATGIESAIELSNAKVTIEHITMAEFIGKTDKLNGRYDVIIIGKFVDNNITTNVYNLKDYNKTDNDITERKANEIKDFINSGQVVYIDNKIASAPNDTKLYKHYNNSTNGVWNQNTTNLVKNRDISQLKVEDIVTAYMNREDKYKEFTIESTNPQGDDMFTLANKDQLGSTEKRKMNFQVSSSDALDEGVTINLYLDINGDGLFKEEEIVKTMNNVNLNQGSVQLQYNFYKDYPQFIGSLYWKIEVVKPKYEGFNQPIVSYTTGNILFRRLSQEKRTIRVLQISSYDRNSIGDSKTGNLNLSTNTKFIELLGLPAVSDYNITREVISYQDFYQGSNPKGPGNNPLNGKYDMVIMGFSDSYGDKLSTKALDEVEKFIKTGQGIMLTHDTIYYQGANYTTSPIIKRFADWIGQSRYVNQNNANELDINGEKIPHDPNKPTSGADNIRVGATNWRINDVNNSNSTEVYKTNSSLITQYPFNLDPNSLNKIRVRRTHGQYLQLDLEDENVVPWFNLTSNNLNNPGNNQTIASNSKNNYVNQYDTRNSYYTYSKGNITFSGTGENTRESIDYPESEMKLFVNTIIKAERGANHSPTIIALDDENTNEVRINQDLIFDTIVKDIDGDSVRISRITFNGSNAANVLEFSPNDASYYPSGLKTKVTIFKDILSKNVDKEIILHIEAIDKKGALGYKDYKIKVVNRLTSLPDLF